MSDIATALYPIIAFTFVIMGIAFGRCALQLEKMGADWQDKSYCVGLMLIGIGMFFDQGYWYLSRVLFDNYVAMAQNIEIIVWTKGMILSGSLFVLCGRLSPHPGVCCITFAHVIALFLAAGIWLMSQVFPQ